MNPTAIRSFFEIWLQKMFLREAFIIGSLMQSETKLYFWVIFI